MADRPKDIPADAPILYDVTVSNGKYRFIIFEDARPPRAYRFDQPWQAMSNMLLGNKAVCALIGELSDRGERETSPEIASLASKVLQMEPSKTDNADYDVLLVAAKRLAGSALGQKE